MFWGQFGNQTPHSKFQSGAMYIWYIYIYIWYIYIYILYIYISYIYRSTLSLQVANLAMARELGLVG